MRPNRGNRFLPLLISLIIIAVAIAAVVSIGRAIFNVGPSNDVAQTDVATKALLNTDSSRSVEMVVRGPIVANEEFQSYSIKVSPSERTMNVYRGYLDTLTKDKTLDNNHDAYVQFVYALDKANMTKIRGDETDDDIRGICATGYVYEFSVQNEGEAVQTLWTSTCSGSKGTLRANKDQLSNLFLNQIPGSEDMVPFHTSSLQL